jgi:hypothetical protein
MPVFFGELRRQENFQRLQRGSLQMACRAAQVRLNDGAEEHSGDARQRVKVGGLLEFEVHWG